MGSNELNSVEHYIIHRLCGVNLNSKEISEPETSYGAKWVKDNEMKLNEVSIMF